MKKLTLILSVVLLSVISVKAQTKLSSIDSLKITIVHLNDKILDLKIELVELKTFVINKSTESIKRDKDIMELMEMYYNLKKD